MTISYRTNDKSKWSLAVDSVGEARQVIKVTAGVFYVVAAILLAASSVLGPSLVLDAVLYIILAAWLGWTFGRVPAVLLVVLAVVSVISAVMNTFGRFTQGGGSNFVLAGLVLWFAVRGAVAAFKLPALRASEASAEAAPIES